MKNFVVTKSLNYVVFWACTANDFRYKHQDVSCFIFATTDWENTQGSKTSATHVVSTTLSPSLLLSYHFGCGSYRHEPNKKFLFLLLILVTSPTSDAFVKASNKAKLTSISHCF